MEFLQKGFKGETKWWMYIATFVCIIFGVALFSLPYSIQIGQLVDLGIADEAKIKDTTYLFTLFDSNINLIYQMLPFVGGLLFLFIAVVFIHKQKLVNLTTGRKAIDWKRVFFSFGIWSSIVIITVLSQFLFQPETIQINFNYQKFMVLFFASILLIPIQTSFEEYVFRGYLMQGLAVLTKNNWFPWLVSSFLFGMLHYANPEVEKLGPFIMLYYIGTGLFLGMLTLLDEGMELSLGFHAANNLITALLVTADWTAFQTHAILRDVSSPNLLTAILPPLIMYPILLVVFSKKYGWKNWKEKLFGKIEFEEKLSSNETA